MWLETRWIGSLVALTPSERTKLGEWFPHLHATFRDGHLETAPKAIGCRLERLKPRPSEEGTGLLTCENRWCAILGLNQ